MGKSLRFPISVFYEMYEVDLAFVKIIEQIRIDLELFGFTRVFDLEKYEGGVFINFVTNHFIIVCLVVDLNFYMFGEEGDHLLPVGIFITIDDIHGLPG